ncbi:hypothetical protein DEA8626_01301 [Defluviimonas aquaemixtae]|uniref:Outer membrane protein beta-barrel domain-containing protein n=1 Tax=Albidovulum aquaemixtae TaxID=1542388 RepID=A0A2R8B569_9RHOB|nr:acyloxyacyl hydrolase [Defluviimonas aquaemixtae]SPH17774.1 hypothetical protein DEA8626_01301 [Defluviimonas aquaemixtae]
MTSRKWQSSAAVAFGLALSLAASEAAMATERWSLTGFAGVMTDNVWEDSLQPWKVEFIESGLIGVGLGYSLPIWREGLSIGPELQAVKHFGRQSHLEFNLPVVVRYRPRRHRFAALEGYAFGIGLSYASEIPQTEIDRDGASSHFLAYWMAELEFSLPREGLSLVARLHHRSDAYGLFATDSGANALVIGLRNEF